MPPPILPKKYQSGWDLRERTKLCIDCAWGDFEVNNLPRGEGLCRRHPPTSFWPIIKISDWCSEFEQSKKAKVQEDEIAAENP